MIKLRWARPDERPHIQNYLFEKMGKVAFDLWANILDCRWNQTDDNYGVVVEESGAIAGFLGIVFVDRVINGQPHRTGNITSWYIAKHLRRGGLGQDMLEHISQDPNTTYIATSANFRSGALLKKIGWQTMEDKRFFWQRDGKTIPSDWQIFSGKNCLPRLDDLSAFIVSAHQGLNMTPHLMIDKSGVELFFCTYAKKKGTPSVIHVEILHSNNAHLLGRGITHIANALLADDRAFLSSDSRFIEGQVSTTNTIPLEVPRFFKPAKKLSAASISFIFSEVLLLDLKVY